MTDDATMRFRLQQVIAYRQVRAAVRAGAGHTLINALIMLGLTYFLYTAVGADSIVLTYGAIGLAELAVGLWKKFAPSVEAVLADGLILLAFGGFALGRFVLAWQGVINGPANPISVFLGLWWIHSAVGSFRAYGGLRRAFPERPPADQIAWFDDLIYEIRTADPETDAAAVDLPTRPKWKVKLLGSTAFFVAAKGDAVVVAGAVDFEIVRERAEQGTGRRKALLRLYADQYPEFPIDDASWANYQAWAAGHARR